VGPKAPVTMRRSGSLKRRKWISGTAPLKRSFSGRHLNFRFGVNSGPVVAGVIGKRKFIYDLWGDTANVASRMESNGQAGIVQVSTETRARLDGAFRCEPRGSVHMKGKGEMAIFHVTGYVPALGETHDNHPY
jgi:adenylate cyclase